MIIECVGLYCTRTTVATPEGVAVDWEYVKDGYLCPRCSREITADLERAARTNLAPPRVRCGPASPLPLDLKGGNYG